MDSLKGGIDIISVPRPERRRLRVRFDRQMMRTIRSRCLRFGASNTIRSEQHVRFRDDRSHDIAETSEGGEHRKGCSLLRLSAILIRLGGRTATRPGAAALACSGTAFAAGLATLLRPFAWI
jgi:hypothetical protein